MASLFSEKQKACCEMRERFAPCCEEEQKACYEVRECFAPCYEEEQKMCYGVREPFALYYKEEQKIVILKSDVGAQFRISYHSLSLNMWQEIPYLLRLGSCTE